MFLLVFVGDEHRFSSGYQFMTDKLYKKDLKSLNFKYVICATLSDHHIYLPHNIFIIGQCQSQIPHISIITLNQKKKKDLT